MQEPFKTFYDAGDKLEDKVRGYFSHYPIFYAFVGGIGIVLFWRGVWHTTDYIMAFLTTPSIGMSSVDLNLGAWWDGPLSFILGSIMLLMTGIFVSNFIGNEIIISGLKGEKKMVEKTEKEIKTEEDRLASIRDQMTVVNKHMEKLQTELDEVLAVSKSSKT